MDISHILELHRLACEEGKQYRKYRFLFSQIDLEQGKHCIGIIGPRGSGKTILLKQWALSKPNALYMALDTFERKDNLFEFIKKMHEDFHVQLFLMDEIHFYPQFEEVLKKAYDFLPIKIVFTSSVSLALYTSSYDLSRRVLLKTVYPFSFREYLFFKYDASFPPLTFSSIVENTWDKKILLYEASFKEYLQGGILPFALQEPQVLALLRNIIQTVIRKDIPSVGNLTIAELDILEKMLSFIGTSPVEGINYSSLSRNLGITKYKAAQYVDFFEKAFILQQVMPKGTNVLKEPKILMGLPYRLLYRTYDDALGALREDFFAEMMRSGDIPFFYLKSMRGEKIPDYLLELPQGNMVVEIGGKGKGRQQFKNVSEKKQIIFAQASDSRGMQRPLLLCGMM